MTWSNVGDEPGRIKLPKERGRRMPKGENVRTKGGLKHEGFRQGEHSDDRRERLRRILRGEK